MIIPFNSTSVILRLNFGPTGLDFESGDLSISTICNNEAAATIYTETNSTLESITTLGTYATPTATKARFKEVDATNHPGLYELQLSNSRFSVSGSKYLIVTASGASIPSASQHVIDLLTPAVVVTPIVGSSVTRANDVAITTYSGEDYTATVSGVDADDVTIDWTALGALVFIVDGYGTTDQLVIANASITKTTTYFQVTIPAATNVADRVYDWAIRILSTNVVVLKGKLRVRYAPYDEA